MTGGGQRSTLQPQGCLSSMGLNRRAEPPPKFGLSPNETCTQDVSSCSLRGWLQKVRGWRRAHGRGTATPGHRVCGRAQPVALGRADKGCGAHPSMEGQGSGAATTSHLLLADGCSWGQQSPAQRHRGRGAEGPALPSRTGTGDSAALAASATAAAPNAADRFKVV